jgi:uracil-DNA glycosylase
MIVVFIGSNPSTRSPDDTAFHISTKSRQILMSWIDNKNIEIIFDNISNIKTENNRPLSLKEIKQSLPILTKSIQDKNPDRIVTLGKTAEKALSLIDLFEFFAAPHPSGLNRQLNDKEYVEKMKIDLNNFIRGYK